MSLEALLGGAGEISRHSQLDNCRCDIVFDMVRVNTVLLRGDNEGKSPDLVQQFFSGQH